MKRGGTWKEEVKGIGKGEEGGGGIEGGGREKSSNCTLSFKGAKNFIPGKALFFLSLENSVSTPLIAAAVHTHGYFHTAVCEDRRGILQSPARPPRPPAPPSPVLPSVGQSRQQTQPSLEPVRADQVSSAGVAEVIAQRKQPRPECMAVDTTKHASSLTSL